MAPLGVYIHYPWCRNRCPYCDFPIAVTPEAKIPHQRYLEEILAELEVRAPAFSGRRLVSVYFGGGTPSLWPPPAIGAALRAVVAAFGGGGPVEVTLEANPVDCAPERLQAWLEAGVTRLSLGVQSTDEGELARLGRDHRMGDGLRALEVALAAGFESVSADVILGTPAGSGGLDSVRRLAALEPPHLSVYELTVEERTPLARAVARGEVTPLPDDRLADLYETAHQELCARGYEHYEISSYARSGHRSAHNTLYWQGAEFLGLGNGAASFLAGERGGRRWTNPRAVSRYLAGGREAEVERLGAEELAADRIWLGMRTADGVEEAAFRGRERLLKWLLDSDLAARSGGRIRPTLRGFLHADEVARRVVTG